MPSPSLLDALATVPDPRRAQGRRFPLPTILATALLAGLCGHHSYRAIARFAHAHEAVLRRAFALTRLPSHVTFRAVLARLDPSALAHALTRYVILHAPPGEPLALDGKAIRATMRDFASNKQDFAAIASAFGHHCGAVVACVPYHNAETSEIEVVRALIDTLDAQGVLEGRNVTLDALHAQIKQPLRLSALAGTT